MATLPGRTTEQSSSKASWCNSNHGDQFMRCVTNFLLEWDAMVDLNSKIPAHGTVTARGGYGVAVLRESGQRQGVFTHNDMEIVVYNDSTSREIEYLHMLKCLQRDKDQMLGLKR